MGELGIINTRASVDHDCLIMTSHREEIQIKVQRLMQGMGRGLQGDDGDFGALALDWIRIGAVSAPLHDGLQQRFVRRGR